MTAARRWLRWPSLTAPGLLLGALFFTASLTPSLVPRPTAVQGALSGLSLAAGYGIGLVLRQIWQALRLPVPAGRLRLWLLSAAGLFCAAVVAIALWKASGWQNTLRALMDLPPVDTGRPATVAAIALAVFAAVVLLGNLVLATGRAMSARLGRVLPGPQAAVIAIVLTAVLFWNIGNGVLVSGAMRAMDASYRQYDALFEDASPRPVDRLKTGGPGSLLEWEGLGRAGREMVAAGPDSATIAAITGRPAVEPLRVYVGLNSAPDPQARAALALAEMIRIGAFSRGTVVITTPTGTGWIDPESQAALEYLTGGDVATVSVQYSYLASWIALLADPDYGVETARAVFSAVYGHWRDLPRDSRPRLYLHGLSLGALNTDLSHDLVQVISDPYDGALLSGPPFNSPGWLAATRARNPGSPAWLPTFRDGSVIRFTAQENRLGDAAAPWGSFRIVYLQYASDAVVFFDPGAIWRPPAWLAGPRGPDVSPDVVWIPVVTFLQLGVDIMMAVQPPLGHGHLYAFPHYVDAWAGLLDPPGWTPAALAALKDRVAQAR
ncbi:MAG: alpha/beta-hydrolase family protein [Paracoccaceae bacterium]|nr:MAG: alpha/beta-hydrolase family protein [Paracoccaceae bacterium]